MGRTAPRLSPFGKLVLDSEVLCDVYTAVLEQLLVLNRIAFCFAGNNAASLVHYSSGTIVDVCQYACKKHHLNFRLLQELSPFAHNKARVYVQVKPIENDRIGSAYQTDSGDTQTSKV